MSLITTKGAKASLFAAALTLLPAAANAADALTLKADDYVGISFWLISMALVAATAFFFIETTRVQGKVEDIIDSVRPCYPDRSCPLFLHA